MMISKDADAPVPFTITVTDAVGTMVASGEFYFDAKVKNVSDCHPGRQNREGLN